MSAKCWCRWVYTTFRTYVLFPMMLPPLTTTHECPTPAPAPTPEDWLEIEVIDEFKIWHLLFMALACAITLSVLACCIMKCRIPRTKQEIEADYKRRLLTRRFRSMLNKVQVDNTNLRTALEKVTELYEKEAKRARRKQRKLQKLQSTSLEKLESYGSDENDEESSSCTSSEVKLTVIQKIKRLIGLGKSSSIDFEE